jgi:hypothetical protein
MFTGLSLTRLAVERFLSGLPGTSQTDWFAGMYVPTGQAKHCWTGEKVKGSGITKHISHSSLVNEDVPSRISTG